jgi:hypothetical protein
MGRLLVITAGLPEDMPGIVQRISDENPNRILVVRLPSVANPLQYGVRNVEGNWNWSPHRDRLLEFLRGPEDDIPAGNVGLLGDWRPVQFLAFLGFAALLAESLLGFVPSSVEM